MPRNLHQGDFVSHFDAFAGGHGRPSTGDVDRGPRRNATRRDADVVIRVKTQKCGNSHSGRHRMIPGRSDSARIRAEPTESRGIIILQSAAVLCEG